MHIREEAYEKEWKLNRFYEFYDFIFISKLCYQLTGGRSRGAVAPRDPLLPLFPSRQEVKRRGVWTPENWEGFILGFSLGNRIKKTKQNTNSTDLSRTMCCIRYWQ